MEFLKLVFGIVSSILAILCFIPYFRDIFRETTTPHSYTWLIWSILQTTAIFVIFKEGGGIYALMSLSIGSLLCTTIFFLSFKYGTKNITTFDTACLIGALAAIGVWLFLDDPLLSIILISIIDFIGFLPTYRKAWVNPVSETSSTYLLSGVANFLSLLALSHYSLTTTTYIASLLMTNFICVFIILIRKKGLVNDKI